MSDLSEAELRTLAKLVKDGPAADGIEQEHAQMLAFHGYIEQREGGLLVTGKGRLKLKGAAQPAD